jgi:predicted alpha/beta hydrolase family esterase
MSIHPKTVFIVHGENSSPEDHWFSWLAQQVKDVHGVAKLVFLPDADIPEFDLWQQALDMQMSNLNEHSIVIAHSLGCLAVAHYLSQHLNHQKIEALICVAGFKSVPLHKPELNSFIQQATLQSRVLHRQLVHRIILFSNNDPVVTPPLALQFGYFMNAQLLEVKQAGHFTQQDGFSEFALLQQILQPLMLSV